MTQKLPIGDVLNEAFQFGLHRWGTVIRFGWAPMLAGILVFAFAAVAILRFEAFNTLEDAESFDALKEIFRLPMPMAVLVGGAAFAAFLFFFSGFMASVYRLVALGEDRPGIFHLRFDGPAIRVFWAYIIYTLINYAVFGVAFLAALAMTGQSPGEVFGGLMQFFVLVVEAAEEGGEPDPAALEPLFAYMSAFGLGFLIAIIPLIYVNVRMTPFLPGSAAENRILLFGSFALSKGHFWSIFGALLLMILLIFAVSIVFQLAITFFDLLSQLLIGQGGGIAVGGAIVSIAVVVASVILQAFTYGVQFSTQAIIYRRLKTGQ